MKLRQILAAMVSVSMVAGSLSLTVLAEDVEEPSPDEIVEEMDDDCSIEEIQADSVALASANDLAQSNDNTAVIEYVNRMWNPNTGKVRSEPASVQATQLTNSMTTLTAGWYYAEGTVSFYETRLNIAPGDEVSIILKNGSTLNCEAGGINVPANSILNIFGQEGDTGRIIATAVNGNAGIGGESGEECGSIYICGGRIDSEGSAAYDHEDGAAIGAGYNSGAIGNITILGGTVNAVGHNGAAGIGGGNNKSISSGNITICGGSVTASSNSTNPGQSAAGIGSGAQSNVGEGVTITISGGTVRASGGDFVEPTDSGSDGKKDNKSLLGGAGIGAGCYGFGGGDFKGTISITGGEVFANGSGSISGNEYTGAAGIGAGCGGNVTSGGTISITGGTVHAYGNYGGAAIGAGSEYGLAGGECNGTVSITGGSVDLMIRNSGGDVPYIGHGHGETDNGTLLFEEDPYSTVNENRTAVSVSGNTPVACNNREDTCRSSTQWTALNVHACTDHCFSVVDTKLLGHTVECEFCGYRNILPHDFNGGICTVCGYQMVDGNPVTITFDVNGGTGTMENVQAVTGYEYMLPMCGFTAPDDQGFDCWSVNGDDKNPGDTIVITGDITVAAKWKTYEDNIGERLEGYSLSLDGWIGVNFYMDLADNIAGSTTARMQFKVSNGTDTTTVDVSVADAERKTVNGKMYYVFRCDVSAKDINSDIKAQIINGSDKGTVYTFTVKSYAEYILENSGDYADSVALVKALLNYGASAQTYFGVVGNGAANNSQYMSDNDRDISDVTIPTPAPASTDLHDGVVFEGASLSLRSETTLSLYFTNLSPDTEFTCSQGKTVEKDTRGEYTIARIRGINARELGNRFTVTFGNNTVTYSPLNYCYDAVNSTTVGEELKDICRALYKYYDEIVKFVPSVSN